MDDNNKLTRFSAKSTWPGKKDEVSYIHIYLGEEGGHDSARDVEAFFF